jgi:phage terminase large subunit GpA-like protein
LVAEWLKASNSRDRKDQREFQNLRIGLPFVEFENVMAPAQLERLREEYAPPGDLAIPAGVKVITVGVDVQQDRLEAEAVGWGAGKESWGIQYVVLDGDPALPAVWQKLDEFLGRTWRTADDRRLGISCTAIDSGDGNRTSTVYAYCRDRENRQVWAIKGRGGPGVPLVSGGRNRRHGADDAALYTIGTDEAKSTLLDRLRLEDPGPGYCHLPKNPAATGYGQPWFDQILAEQPRLVQRAGRERTEWILPKGLRNEALDCRIYAMVAMEIYDADLDGTVNAYSWL